MSGMLDVHEISKRYGNKNVLKNVTFSVPLVFLREKLLDLSGIMGQASLLHLK